MKGISSVYGFIMIFLLSMASIQTWSSAVSAMDSIQGASDQSHQLQQLQSIERLSLSLSGGNLTIENSGQVPSTVEFLRLLRANSSRTVPLDVPVGVGASVVERVPGGYSVEAITSLGNVFLLTPASDPQGTIWTGAAGAGGSRNTQLFENPYNPSLFYVSSGARVYAFHASGSLAWSFDAGVGVVTDVMPISGGQVYVSVGYAAPSNAGSLYELGEDGHVATSFSVRVLDSPDGPSDVATQSVSRGVDSNYVYYDGWFYSAGGPTASSSVSGGLLAGTDASSFYLYSPVGGSTYGICQPWGNEMVFDSYSPSPSYPGVLQPNWTAFAYLGPCTRYDPQLLGASTGGGVLATLFAAPYFSDSPLQALPGYNPYIAVISASGQTLYDKEAPSNGYSAVATDGSDVYLALPQLDEVQVLSLSSQTVATHDVGIPASNLVCDYGLLFAISPSEVKVYDGSMVLVRTINLAPLTLASSSNSFPFEPALQAPSFLVLNSTSYAALADNATGYSTLILGNYA
jgi:hypothetical protein